MPILVPEPPPGIVAIQQLPPLSFVGFRARMPMSEAHELIKSAGGSLRCKATTDPRLRECTGALPMAKGPSPFQVLISSVQDTAAVIVLTGTIPDSVRRRWVGSLTWDFGTPNHTTGHRTTESWQWIRRKQMLRVIRHGSGDTSETAITLTDGPLLDGLGPPQPPAKEPKKQKPD